MGECRTTANLQRAPGFYWLQDFHYQTNEHLFQCRLAVELLLLLKPPPKYHSFHKTCAAAAASEELSAFQPLCQGLGTPKLSVQYSGTPQLWRGLFFPPSMNHQWWHKVSPTGIMVQVGAVIPWELNSGSLMSAREGAAAAMEQQLVWGRAKCPTEGAVRRGSHPVHALKRRKEETTPAIYFSPSFTIYTSLWETSLSTIEFLRLRSDFTHTPGRPLLVPQHHPPLVCFLKWLTLSPFPKGGSVCTQLCQIVLFSRDARQERKRSLLFSSLCIQGLPAWLLLFLQQGKDNSLLLFLNWHNSAAFSIVTEHHWWTPTLWAHKRTGIVKYIIYKK